MACMQGGGCALCKLWEERKKVKGLPRLILKAEERLPPSGEAEGVGRFEGNVSARQDAALLRCSRGALDLHCVRNKGMKRCLQLPLAFLRDCLLSCIRFPL